MRCCACDRLLNDFEATRKSKTTGDYLDLCNKCYGSIQEDLATDIRSDLDENDVPDDELEFNDYTDWTEEDGGYED